MSLFSDFRQARARARREKEEANRRLDRLYKKWADDLATQEALQDRSRREFTHGDMQDLINAAVRGVTVEVTTSDGTKYVIRKEDNFDRYTKAIAGGELF